MRMKRCIKFKFDQAFWRRFFIVSLIYILFMIIVWGTISRQFPNGIQPNWLFWLIIGLSISLYIVFIILIEIANMKKVR